ncbi:hypothetical protein ACWCW7_35225 [Nocardia tengchongensis]
MAEPHVDRAEHGAVKWFKDFGPLDTYGAYAGPCDHLSKAWPGYFDPRCIAWGWDFKHYELGECSSCGSRAWFNEKVQPTTEWIATRPQSAELVHA